jgi:Plasmid pRiA4b ORF-3-like protein
MPFFGGEPANDAYRLGRESLRLSRSRSKPHNGLPRWLKHANRVVRGRFSAPCLPVARRMLNLKPAIWRQILVPGSIKLPKLHGVLLWAMGWDGGHLHEFVFGDTNYGQPDPDFPSDPPMLNEARVRHRPS